MYLQSFDLRFGGIFFLCLGRHLLFFTFLIPIDIYRQVGLPPSYVASDLSCIKDLALFPRKIGE